MSFTYDLGNLEKSLVSQVRLNIGNTSETDPVVLQDEEIAYFLKSNYDNVQHASVAAINVMINKASGITDKQTGQVQESASELINHLIRARDDMLNSISRNVPKHMGFTGMLEEDRKAVREDVDIFQNGINMLSETPGDSLLITPIDDNGSS